ncbi:hypothetical protein [Pseudomonas sp. B21-047]|uniref:hypothetical protein n=1 Tax=Pseudomonas sp. B21-047 TaxID=2895489 RepID=UPI002160887A|nr:hypothetical protein [Pseudomonas sp. B21-047]UVL04067.1 hypothetical protein LOY26_00420 [Pseudomonas sp. B21-047]
MTRWTLPLIVSLTFHVSAMAADDHWTAHISAEGEVLRSWPKWIEKVEKTPQSNYFTQYKMHLNKHIVQQDPRFCSVSPIDGSTQTRLLHGHAKVVGMPSVDGGVTVNTQLIDVNGASGDNSLAFMLMCMR